MFVNSKSFPRFISVLIVGWPLLEMLQSAQIQSYLTRCTLQRWDQKILLSFSNVSNFSGEMKKVSVSSVGDSFAVHCPAPGYLVFI